MEHPSDEAVPAGPTFWTFVLAGVHLLVAVLALVAMTRTVKDGDVLRFNEIATTAGVPWRDFAIEYAPGEAIAVELLGRGTTNSTGVRLVLVAAAADVIVYLLLLRGWGRDVADRALGFTLPLLPILFLRFDLVPVALALGGFVLIRDGRGRTGGLLLALAVATKLWPAVLLPVLLIERRWRPLGWAIGTGAIMLGAWLALAGMDGPRQVLGFRGSTGWGVESLIGGLVWVVAGGWPQMAQGSPRIGSMPPWSGLALAVGLISALATSWWAARRWEGDLLGGPALGAIALLLCFSPLISQQYAIWLVPFAAIATGEPESRLIGLMGGFVVLLTGALYLVSQMVTTAPLEQAAIVFRNAALIAIIVLWAAATRRELRPAWTGSTR